MRITERIHEFREAIRHLWNSYMRNSATWDTVDEFGKIAEILFSESVLCRAGVDARPIPMGLGPEVLTEYRLLADHSGRLPLHPNRDIPATGYWDYPVNWIPAEGPYTIHPICFFDFDVKGWRRIQFYRARIIQCTSHPEIEGRDALIECAYVDIEAEGTEPALEPNA